MNVSLFASAVRPKLWTSLFNSLEGTSVEYEVVFSGHTTSKEIMDILILSNLFKEPLPLIYTHTSTIKPAQCYEIARRHCTGEVVVWIADDCEFPKNVIGRAYDYWKAQNNEKLILSLQTKESGYGCKEPQLFPMETHTFYSLMRDTPLMAPIGMISRKFLDELGGFDRRYVAGQYENDAVLRAVQNGAKVEIFGDINNYVEIDHLRKSIEIGESTDEESFKNRPFASGYATDRQVLENSWTTFDQVEAFKRLQNGERPISLRRVSPVQIDKFEPYADNISLTGSESNKGKWL